MDEQARFRRRIQFSIVWLLLVTVGGTLGYHFVEGWTLLESLYMVAISLSTVGYGLVRELGTAGTVMTIVLVLFGVSGALYAIATVAEYVVEGHLAGTIKQRRRERLVTRLQDHYIVCGFGRVGQGVVNELLKEGEVVCLVEMDPALLSLAESLGLPAVEGDATEERTLLAAGISRCLGLVAALPSDERNAFVTLSARGLAPNIKIVARAEDDTSIDKLRRVGADYAITPYDAGAQQMTFMLTKPLLAEAITMLTDESVGGMVLRQIEIPEGSPIEGRTIGQLAGGDMRVSVLALKRGDEELQAMPSPEMILIRGDVLVVVGTSEDLAKLSGMEAPA